MWVLYSSIFLVLPSFSSISMPCDSGYPAEFIYLIVCLFTFTSIRLAYIFSDYYRREILGQLFTVLESITDQVPLPICEQNNFGGLSVF